MLRSKIEARCKVIGTFIGKALGYTVQGLAYAKIAEVMSPQSIIIIRTGTKYGSRIIDYTARKYVRTDFKEETIFSDAIDAVFFAD